MPVEKRSLHNPLNPVSPFCEVSEMAIVLYDDFCESCTAWARFIEKRSKGTLSLLGQETPDGKAVIEKRPLELSDVDSVFFVDDEGKWTAKSTAALQIVRQLRFPWPMASIGLLIPRFIRDAVYDAYAKRRFRTFQ
ncbi:MAG: thiol-disulfide oxidoreductase [Euryarchaeota archaeon]|nr:thiol-disulfide oxidoreductase [Euryarchaeota archaeon]DAC43238.1 MAG TPA: DUF393 domain-containing protein [Candidatus Poseidoniales archaeon]